VGGARALDGGARIDVAHEFRDVVIRRALEAAIDGIQLPRKTSRSLFLSEGKVTGTDRTAMLGRYPRCLSSALTRWWS
jgi:hypothetical protein